MPGLPSPADERERLVLRNVPAAVPNDPVAAEPAAHRRRDAYVRHLDYLRRHAHPRQQRHGLLLGALAHCVDRASRARPARHAAESSRQRLTLMIERMPREVCFYDVPGARLLVLGHARGLIGVSRQVQKPVVTAEEEGPV